MSVTPELVKIAVRNVARNRRRSAITAGTVVVGVIAILFSKAYIHGLHGLIEQAVTEAGAGSIQVQRRGYLASQDLATLELDLPEDLTMEKTLRDVPGVRELAPRLRFMGMVSNGAQSTTFVGTAMELNAERKVCPRGPGGVTGASENLEGSLPTNRDDAVILGVGLAENLKVKIGDTVTLLVQTQRGGMDAADVTVAGLFAASEPTERKHLLAVPLSLAQRLLHMPGRITAYALALEREAPLEETAAGIRVALGQSQLPVEVHTWPALAPYYRDVITLQNTVLDVVIGIIFVLVLGGVVNTMLMSVFERTREIGTLMSIGFRRRRILGLFLFESIALATIGSVIGVALGLAIVAITNHKGIAFHIPAVGEITNRPILPLPFVGWVLVGTFLGAALGGLYPAYRASRLRPVEALHAT